MLAACAARRWLARNAAGVKIIRSRTEAAASACTSLVSCLPALEHVELCLYESLDPGDWGCLLEALAWCPRLRALDLCVVREFTLPERDEGDELHQHLTFPDAAAFAKLRSLTKLALSFGEDDPYTLADVVGAIVPLTGLAELELGLPQPAVLPAALGQLKGLRSLELQDFNSCVLEAGCLDLPNLLSLDFRGCNFEDAEVLPGVTALRSLTRIEFSDGFSPRFFDPQLVQLPGLQRMVYETNKGCIDGASLGLSRLPADMGSLSSTLLHLDFSGHQLTQFPLALTQLVALECLRASENEFAELPAAITALSRLTELRLGRASSWKDPLQLHEKRPLDVRALGDLSGFPALCKLSFASCEVIMCGSVLAAVRHACLARLCFSVAHPAPECEPMVLQLNQALRRLRRGSVLEIVSKEGYWRWTVDHALQHAQGQAPFQKFKAALEASGL